MLQGKKNVQLDTTNLTIEHQHQLILTITKYNVGGDMQKNYFAQLKVGYKS